jgi:hypothetical protein
LSSSQNYNDQENVGLDLDSKYFQEFIQTFASVNNMGYLLNPLIANQYLKTLNMNPHYQNRDRVEKMVFNPNDNELGLRRVSEHLYNTQLPYKRLIHYYVDQLTFDWYPIPTNIENDKDFKKDTFKKDYKRMFEWFDKFDVKKEFKKIALGMMLEDAKFTYLRESEYGLTLQELPSDYSIIDANSQLGYLYSFNLNYFSQIGADINGFDPDFRKFYAQMTDMKQNNTYYPNIRSEMRNGQWAYWQQINPNKGWVFKFHDNYASLIPPFLGLFMDAVDFDTIRKLQDEKTALDTYKMIFGTIPRHKDGSNKSGNSKDDFAIDPKTLSSYMKLVKASLPDGIDFKAAPLENVQLLEFDGHTEENIVGNSLKNFYSKSGAEKALFGSDKPNASTMKASIQNDGDFVRKIYNQFNTFCTYHINKITQKYKFKIIFEGTTYDQEERRKKALEEWQNGLLTPRLPASMGMSIRDLNNSIGLMQSLGFPENLKPIQSSFTLSKDSAKNDKAGRPASDNVSESKDISNDYDININKSVE